MLTNMKRFTSFMLALVIIFGLLPAGLVHAEEASAATELSAESYAEADSIFDLIDAAESKPAYKNATQTQKTEAAMEIVKASESYVEGSLEQNGNSFTWWTDDGVHCVYSPRMRDIESERTPETSCDEIVNEPIAMKGGSPTGNQVYLIGPYYGSDDSFTNQYKNEARRVASAIGDTDGYTLYSGTAATVDKVAEAVSNGAVVFFDSHGTTDYENPSDEYDFITEANYSYLCLTSTTGLTTEDYNDGALYYSDGICINGDTIANHMTKNSPSGFLWMAICLGMGTDTICQPLREKGVEVVYGYSESVSFEGDYRFEEAFWDEMITGSTVANAISKMKSTWGNWDWSTQIADDYGSYDGYETIAEARADFTAFPVVVSDEDSFPGKRTKTSYGADALQTVKSTYTLGEVQEVTDPTDPKQILTEAYALGANEDLPYEVTLTGTITSVYTAYNTQYKNVTVIMEVAGCEDMPIKCYRLQGSGADQIGVGDTITVTGTVTKYQHSSGDLDVQFKQGCTLVSWIDGGCTNHNWLAATCTKPKTCSICGTTEGSALGHTWVAATCTTPKTCSVCNATEGSVASHTDNNNDETCDVCGANMSVVTPPVTAGGNTYVKVTTTPSDWTGQYLIVYEEGLLAMDGSLTVLEAVKNNFPVTIDGDTIIVDDAYADSYFTISAISGGYAIQSASGYYIGNTGNSNKLMTSQTEAYKNTLSISGTETTILSSGGSYLRFNKATDQMRFRYFKSSSYGNQQPLALYKLVEACNHSYDNGVVTIEPTTEAVGEMTYTCTVCGATYTEEIPMVEVPEGPVVDETLVMRNDGALNLAAYIGAQFSVTTEIAEKYDTVYIVITHNGEEKTFNLTKDSTGAIYFAEYGIAAKQMADAIDIALFATKDDVTYVGQVIEGWTIKAKLVGMLDQYYQWMSYGGAYKTTPELAAAMLAYGAAAQNQFSYNLDNLATDGVQAKYLALVPTEAPAMEAMPTFNNTGFKSSLYNPAFMLDDVIKASLTFAIGDKNIQNYKARVTINGVTEDYELTQYVAGGNAYPGYAYVIIDSIVAADLRNDFTVTIMKGETATSTTYTFSMENMAAKLMASRPDMITAIMNYADAAHARFRTK